MGISKGAFYHHFKSKDELLDSLSNSFAEEAMADVLRIKEEAIDALSKLNKIFSFSRQFKSANKEMMQIYIEALYKPSNLLLLDKMRHWSWDKISPILAEIVNQGKKEGLFDIDNIKECIHIIGDLTFGLAKANADFILRKRVTEGEWTGLERMNSAYERAIERILGIQKGSIKVIDKEFRAPLKTCKAGF